MTAILLGTERSLTSLCMYIHVFAAGMREGINVH